MNDAARQIFLKALDENSPARLIDKNIDADAGCLKIGDKCWMLKNHPVYIIAAGKASEAMCAALREKMTIENGNYICIAPQSGENGKNKIRHFYASHPYPDEKSVRAAESLIRFVKGIPDDSLVLFALSGGASSLVCKPAKNIAVKEVAEINKLLLQSGAAIDEINSVRKHLSSIKGGQLLHYFQPGITLINLVISDVPGDDLEIIGSGPTIPDSSTFQDAYHTLLEYDLWEKLPASARKHIEKGLTGEEYETVKPRENPIQNHFSFIIGSAEKFAGSMGEIAEEEGFSPWIADSYYSESVDKVVRNVVKQIKQIPNKSDEPDVLIFYGESTVKVTGEGEGGRNQEMALRAAVEIDGMKHITWLSAGTDGVDGPTDAAGAIVDGETAQKAAAKGLKVNEYIKHNDAYHFHEQMHTLLKTGPTGNNMMDVVLVVMSYES